MKKNTSRNKTTRCRQVMHRARQLAAGFLCVAFSWSVGGFAQTGTRSLFPSLSPNMEIWQKFPPLARDLAGSEWTELLLNHSVTDLCGLQDWHVRRGYQVLRHKYSTRWPLSFDRLYSLRSDAIMLVEDELVGKGYDNFKSFCGTHGVSSADFFIDVWSKTQLRRVELNPPIQLGQNARGLLNR